MTKRITYSAYTSLFIIIILIISKTNSFSQCSSTTSFKNIISVWSDNASWSYSAPTSEHTSEIKQGSCSLNSDQSTCGLTIDGGTLNLGSSTLTVSGDFKYLSGKFIANNGTVKMYNSANQILSGNPITFNNLTIECWWAEVVLNTDITIKGTLNLFDGTLNLNGHTIIFEDGASIVQLQGTINGKGNVNFKGNNDVTYKNGCTTGIELPKDLKSLRNLTINCSKESVVLSQPTFVNGNLNIACGELDVSKNNFKIEILGKLINNGLLTQRKGTIVFKGDNKNINSSSPLIFNNLVLNLSISKNILELNTNIDVKDSLVILKGNINLNNNTINLSSNISKVYGENNDNLIFDDKGFGKIKVMRVLGSLKAYNNIGGIGISITTSNIKPDTTYITRGHQSQTSNLNGSVNRYYEICPINNSGLNASITFNYFEKELNNQTEALLKFYKTENNGLYWTEIAPSTVNIPVKNVELYNVNSFSKWTLSNANNIPSANKISYFNALLENKIVSINWAVSIEDSNRVFFIEKSNDGIEYSQIATVKGKGNSNKNHSYISFDNNPVLGLNYYRLKLVNSDNSINYSNVFIVKNYKENKGFKIGKLSIFDDNIQSYLSNISSHQIFVDIFDVSGKLIFNDIFKTKQNELKLTIPLILNKSGVYYIYVSNGKETVVEKSE